MESRGKRASGTTTQYLKVWAVRDSDSADPAACNTRAADSQGRTGANISVLFTGSLSV